MAKALENYELKTNLAAFWKKTVFFSLGVVAISSCQQMSQSDSSTALSPAEAYYGTLPSATTALLSSAATQEPPPPAAPEVLALTPSELQEFDSIMLELDPDQQLVTSISQWKLSTTVNVTLGPGFKSLSQERQSEVLAGIRGGLSQICACSPELKFGFDDEQ